MRIEKQQLDHYAELVGKGHESEAAWLRQILTLAAGALALLAGLGPDIPPNGLSKYLLATTWGGLGLGIVLGAGATYVSTDRAVRVAKAFGEHLIRVSEGKPSKPMEAVPINRFYALCKPLMLLSLLIAVFSLTAFAILDTLAVNPVYDPPNVGTFSE